MNLVFDDIVVEEELDCLLLFLVLAGGDGSLYFGSSFGWPYEGKARLSVQSRSLIGNSNVTHIRREGAARVYGRLQENNRSPPRNSGIIK